jgi:hypothetical protein
MAKTLTTSKIKNRDDCAMLSLSKPKPQLGAGTAPAQPKPEFGDGAWRNWQQNITVNEDCAAPFAMRIKAGGLNEMALFKIAVAERLETLLQPRTQMEISEQ